MKDRFNPVRNHQRQSQQLLTLRFSCLSLKVDLFGSLIGKTLGNNLKNKHFDGSGSHPCR